MSHKAKRLTSIALIFAVLAHFGLGHRHTPVFMLCFAGDGHVAVERAGHDHGVDADKLFPNLAETGAYFAHGDSPCTDFPVVDDDHGGHFPLTGLSKISLDLALQPLVFLAFLVIPYARVIARRLVIPDPPLSDSRLLALRSVVLLI